MSEFYNQLDELFSGIEKILNNYCKSTILQNYYMDTFSSFFYATLINLFFVNLNRNNTKEMKLPYGRLGQIKNKYKDLRKNINLILSASLKRKEIDDIVYAEFKTIIQKDFPEFGKLIQEIENKINLTQGKDYLRKKVLEIKKFGKSDKDFDVFFQTKFLEVCIQNGKYLPIISKKRDKIVKELLKKIVPQISQMLLTVLNTTQKEMLHYLRNIQKQFKIRLYQRWEEPLDLLECIINFSSEIGEKHINNLSAITTSKNNFIHEALIKIHVRALQISREILVLLKSGYADGANSRWRSLHELAVISFFLYDKDNEVSQRYLEHEIVKKYKEALAYRANYKKLGYPPFSIKEFNKIRREKERLCIKYADRFQKDYGWIPTTILPDGQRHFRALEEIVKMNKLRPFYNLASDSVHGGAKGFYRLGLMNEEQHKKLLAGPSNFGLADPMQNTAISLSHVTVCLLSLKPNLENIIQMRVILNYVDEIGIKAVNVQKSIESEEYSKV